MPMRLHMQLEDDARLMMLTPEAPELFGIVAIERLRDGKTTLRGSDELRHLQQHHLTCRDIIDPESGRRGELPQVADVMAAFAGSHGPIRVGHARRPHRQPAAAEPYRAPVAACSMAPAIANG